VCTNTHVGWGGVGVREEKGKGAIGGCKISTGTLKKSGTANGCDRLV